MSTPNAVSKRGGARPGAGRKASGRKPYLIRLKPEAMEVLLAEKAKRGFSTIGEVIETQLLGNNRSDI